MFYIFERILHKNIKKQKQYLALIIIKENVSWAANQHIRMIFKGSCDNEDWSNDAENWALNHRNKLHVKIYSNRKQLF